MWFRLGWQAQGLGNIVLAQLGLWSEDFPGNAGKIEQVAIEWTKALEVVIVVMGEVGMDRRLDEAKLEVSIPRRHDRIPAEVEERSPGLPPADSELPPLRGVAVDLEGFGLSQLKTPGLDLDLERALDRQRSLMTEDRADLEDIVNSGIETGGFEVQDQQGTILKAILLLFRHRPAPVHPHLRREGGRSGPASPGNR